MAFQHLLKFLLLPTVCFCQNLTLKVLAALWLVSWVLKNPSGGLQKLQAVVLALVGRRQQKGLLPVQEA
jgi:hypothetical protein